MTVIVSFTHLINFMRSTMRMSLDNIYIMVDDYFKEDTDSLDTYYFPLLDDFPRPSGIDDEKWKEKTNSTKIPVAIFLIKNSQITT
jgi:hypothetical protein